MRYIILLISLFFSIALQSLEFDLKQFSNPRKYGWKNIDDQRKYRESLSQRQKLLQLYALKRQNPTKNMIKSIIAPGWGHFSSHHYTKGQILLTTEIILMGASFYYHNIAMDYYKKYKNATYIIDITNYYNKLKTPYTLSVAFFSLGIVLWTYTVFDAAVVTRDYNEKLWNEILNKYNKKKILITPSGITMRF